MPSRTSLVAAVGLGLLLAAPPVRRAVARGLGSLRRRRAQQFPSSLVDRRQGGGTAVSGPAGPATAPADIAADFYLDGR